MSGTREAWRLWKLHEALVFERGEKGSGRYIIVPQGFISDGPSVPRVLWPLLPVWGTWGRAGIVHDYLCAKIVLGSAHPEAPSRRLADEIFYEAMATLGVSFVTRLVMYFGVRLGSYWPHSISAKNNAELLKER